MSFCAYVCVTADEELLLDLAAYYGLATGKPEVDPREFLELVRKENPGLPVATLAQRVVQYVRAHRVHPAYVSDRKRLFAPQPKCITEEAIRRSTSAPGARISTSNAVCSPSL